MKLATDQYSRRLYRNALLSQALTRSARACRWTLIASLALVLGGSRTSRLDDGDTWTDHDYLPPIPEAILNPPGVNIEDELEMPDYMRDSVATPPGGQRSKGGWRRHCP